MIKMKKCIYCEIRFIRCKKYLHRHCKKAYHRGKIDGGFNDEEKNKIKEAVELIDGAFT